MIRPIKLFLVLTLLSLAVVTNSQQLAFPGAEGYGRFASGGRGDGTTGKIAIVTNLDDNVENPPVGSLRWAFNQGTEILVDPIIGEYTVDRPLTIVFRVGGVIHLKGDLKVKRNNVTLAGQTAPGDGICIRGATVNLGGSKNVIIRYMRFRPGDELSQETSALRIENGGNYIIDHCSMSWAIEETTHFSSSKNLTVQWCILSESLYSSIHKKGDRGYAAQWGGEYASYHHNLLAHNRSRNPRINGSNKNDVEALVDYRNNVNYNWGSSGAFYGGEWEGTPDCTGFSHVNVVNNYFIPGPATEGQVIAAPSTNRGGVTLCGYAKWFVNGNVMAGREDITDDNWLGIESSHKDEIKWEIEHVQSDGVLEAYDNYTETAEEALESVLKGVGAVLPKRDTIDKRIIAEVKGEREIVRYPYTADDGQETPKKGVSSGIIDTQMNLVPEEKQGSTTVWDVYSFSNEAPIDTDNDGMSDEWELENGLNPNDSLDFRLIASNGYSNLENYLNDLTLIVSVSDIRTESNFKVYPNPVSNILYLKSDKQLVQVELFNINGEIIKNITTNNIQQINTESLVSGLYLIKATSSDEQIFRTKFIKK